MVGESGTSHVKKRVHHYYKCVSVKEHRNCDKKTVRKEWIEDIVLKQIQQLIFDDALIDRLSDMLLEELGKENTALPILKKELAAVKKGIANMLNAIQSGIFTPSTKQRLEELEETKNDLSIRIMQEEMTKPTVSKDIFTSWLCHFRKYDISDKEQRQKLVDQFVNTIYLFDDHLELYLNFRENAVTVTFDDTILAKSKQRKPKSNKSSDLTAEGA